MILHDNHDQLLQHLRSDKPKMQLRAAIQNNLPFSPNPLFQGRLTILDQLSLHLKPGSRPKGLSQAILYGLGGVGKTQLALKFAWDHIRAYDIVLWITAESGIKLAESYGQAAHSIGAPSSVHQPDQLREALKEWLISNSTDGKITMANPKTRVASEADLSVEASPMNWLLVFDNVNDLKEVEPFLPYGSNGTIILTTRDLEVARQLSRPAERFEVPLFTKQESHQFLLDLVLNNCDEVPTSGDLRAAEQIASSLGWLPLALQLVGSRIAYVNSSLSRFVEENGERMHQIVFAEQTKSLSFYTSPVNTTWTLRLDSLPSESQLLADIVAFLDADGVPPYLFEERSWEEM